MTAPTSNEVNSISETLYEVNSQIQPAFVKHSKRGRKYPRKYYSINQLMDIISPAYPNIETLVVYLMECLQVSTIMSISNH